MKSLRQLHLYLGCVFTPLIIYFSLSGAWQVFRFNDVPKGPEGEHATVRIALRALSNPHRNSALPGYSDKTSKSASFNVVAALMALGMVVTSTIGVVLAFRFSRRPLVVAGCLVLGTIVPLALLALSAAK